MYNFIIDAMVAECRPVRSGELREEYLRKICRILNEKYISREELERR